MKKLVFGKGLLTPTVNQEKNYTVRKYAGARHDFEDGEWFIGEFLDGIDIPLVIARPSVRGSFEDLVNRHALDVEFFDTLKDYYPDITEQDQLVIIFYEVAKIDGVPVIAFNEHANV